MVKPARAPATEIAPPPPPPVADHPPRPTLADRLTDPDFVDLVWQYLLANWPQRLADIPAEEVDSIKQHIRRCERGQRPYISPACVAAREQEAQRILALFNGRNATEVARRIGCSRAKVYRVLKQAGRPAGTAL